MALVQTGLLMVPGTSWEKHSFLSELTMMGHL